MHDYPFSCPGETVPGYVIAKARPARKTRGVEQFTRQERESGIDRPMTGGDLRAISCPR